MISIDLKSILSGVSGATHENMSAVKQRLLEGIKLQLTASDPKHLLHYSLSVRTLYGKLG